MAILEGSFQLQQQETESDGKASAALTLIRTEPLGLALSGGGVRAALFSLGVVIGLIETGCHKRIHCIASVSGGSILNAALAHAQSLKGVKEVAEFEKFASTLATSLAWEGVFALTFRSALQWMWHILVAIGVVIGRAIPIIFGFSVFFAGPVIAFIQQNKFHWGDFYYEVPWKTVGWIGLVSLVVSVSLSFWLSRGYLQQAMYRKVLTDVANGRSLHVKDWGSVEQEPDVKQEPDAKEEFNLMHVLVATDLLSGEPIYFSNKLIYCKPYGWSTPENIRTEEALYSSAAFPAVFPPKKMKISKLRFQNGDMPGELPRMLRLADGGIYNNLGSDWFEILRRETQASPLWPFGELSLEPQPLSIEKSNVIVVNAGARSSQVRRLPPLPVARIMSVLYDNTVRPRVISLQRDKLPVIDIEQTPLVLLESLVKEEVGCKSRASALQMKLAGKADQFWADFSRDTAGTRTKLTPAGYRAAARLMLHGYLSSLVLFHVRFGGNLPNRIRGEHDFLKLVAPSGRR